MRNEPILTFISRFRRVVIKFKLFSKWLFKSIQEWHVSNIPSLSIIHYYWITKHSNWKVSSFGDSQHQFNYKEEESTRINKLEKVRYQSASYFTWRKNIELLPGICPLFHWKVQRQVRWWSKQLERRRDAFHSLQKAQNNWCLGRERVVLDRVQKNLLNKPSLQYGNPIPAGR